jgi:hypothetical protein
MNTTQTTRRLAALSQAGLLAAFITLGTAANAAIVQSAAGTSGEFSDANTWTVSGGSGSGIPGNNTDSNNSIFNIYGNVTLSDGTSLTVPGSTSGTITNAQRIRESGSLTITAGTLNLSNSARLVVSDNASLIIGNSTGDDDSARLLLPLAAAATRGVEAFGAGKIEVHKSGNLTLTNNITIGSANSSLKSTFLQDGGIVKAAGMFVSNAAAPAEATISGGTTTIGATGIYIANVTNGNGKLTINGTADLTVSGAISVGAALTNLHENLTANLLINENAVVKAVQIQVGRFASGYNAATDDTNIANATFSDFADITLTGSAGVGRLAIYNGNATLHNVRLTLEDAAKIKNVAYIAMNQGSELFFDIDSAAFDAQIQLRTSIANSLQLALTARLYADLSNYTGSVTSSTVFTLITGADKDYSATYANLLQLLGEDNTVFSDAGLTPTLSWVKNNGTERYDLQLAFTAVPEPATVAVLLGILTLGVLLRRRTLR